MTGRHSWFTIAVPTTPWHRRHWLPVILQTHREWHTMSWLLDPFLLKLLIFQSYGKTRSLKKFAKDSRTTIKLNSQHRDIRVIIAFLTCRYILIAMRWPLLNTRTFLTSRVQLSIKRELVTTNAGREREPLREFCHDQLLMLHVGCNSWRCSQNNCHSHHNHCPTLLPGPAATNNSIHWKNKLP